MRSGAPRLAENVLTVVCDDPQMADLKAASGYVQDESTFSYAAGRKWRCLLDVTKVRMGTYDDEDENWYVSRQHSWIETHPILLPF